MCDFHNGVYFPTRAMLDGVSPYGAEYAATNPVARQIPFFSPSILVLHAPFAWMPLRVAEIAYFAFSVVLVLLIGILVASTIEKPIRWDLSLAVAAGLVFSRGGHITLFDGYFTFQLVLATFLAIHWGDRRPWLSALALVVVASKPTYILPLGFLMLARGNVKAIVIGAVFSIVAAGIPFAWLAAHEGNGDLVLGIEVLREQISDSQEIHRDQEDESPVHSWTRVDLLAVIAKWTGSDPKEAMHLIVMAAILVPAMVVLFQRRRRQVDDGLPGLTGAVILTTMLVSLYHQSYDTILVAAPLAGLLVGVPPYWKNWAGHWRWIMAVMMTAPLFNYLSTRMILGRVDSGVLVERALTSINGICLAVAMIGGLILAARQLRDTSTTD